MILIAEDNLESVTVLRHILTKAEYQVFEAHTGKEALDLANAHSPALILLDVLMPEMDGFETCRCLKANTRTADIPVIFLTVLDDIEHKLKGFDVGGADYIVKPFLEEEVLARVRTHIALRRYQRYLEHIVQQRTEELLGEIREVRRLEKYQNTLSDAFLHALELFIRHYWVRPPGIGLQEELSQYEKQRVWQTLIRHDGNVSAAAETLQISERRLYRRMKKYKLSSKLLTLLSAQNDTPADPSPD